MHSPQLFSFYSTCFCSSSTFFQGYVALQCLKSCWSCRWVWSIFGFMETWKALLGVTSAFLSDAEACKRPEAHSVWTCDSDQQWRNVTSDFAHALKSKIGRSIKVLFQANSFQNVTLNVNNRVPRMSLQFVWKPPLAPTLATTAVGPWTRPLTPESKRLF